MIFKHVFAINKLKLTRLRLPPCFQLEKMKAELDEARLSDRQLRHKLELQSEMLSSKSEELRALSERAHETMSSEVLGLQIDKTELEAARVRAWVCVPVSRLGETRPRYH